MACGIPVIGSQIGGICEYINDAENGFVFNPGDYEELAKKILFYEKLSLKKRNNMREKALRTSKKYDNKKVSEELSAKIIQVVRAIEN